MHRELILITSDGEVVIALNVSASDVSTVSDMVHEARIKFYESEEPVLLRDLVLNMLRKCGIAFDIVSYKEL